MARRKNNNVYYVPHEIYYEVKNPPTLFPVNWERFYGEDRVRYVEDPIFDEKGNYIETKIDVYVMMKKVKFMCVKRKNVIAPKFKQRNLFENINKKKEDEEND